MLLEGGGSPVTRNILQLQRHALPLTTFQSETMNSTWVNLQGSKHIEWASSNGSPHNSNEMWFQTKLVYLVGS